MNLTTGTPAWLAVQLATGGETIGVCMLATALLVSEDADERLISETFTGMARAHDPLADLQAFWTDIVAQHPWMDGKIGPLVDWLEGASDAMGDTVRRLAERLSTISVWGCDGEADGDLLARVIQTMRAIETRTFHTGEFAFYTPMQAAMMFTLGIDEVYTPHKDGTIESTDKRELPREGQGFMDAWAGSGTRVIGLSYLMRGEGIDPTKIRWTLQEADGMLLALAAVNMVVYNIGENITLIHDRQFQDTWQAAHAAGFKRIHDLPPASVLEPRW